MCPDGGIRPKSKLEFYLGQQWPFIYSEKLIVVLIFMPAWRYPKMKNKSRKSGQKPQISHRNPREWNRKIQVLGKYTKKTENRSDYRKFTQTSTYLHNRKFARNSSIGICADSKGCRKQPSARPWVRDGADIPRRLRIRSGRSAVLYGPQYPPLRSIFYHD